MYYIGNAFSPNMVGNNTIKFETITKNEFIKVSKTAKSVIGHPEIAKNFNLPLNRESITLKLGDILYTVTPRNRPNEGKKVSDGTKYEFIPESEGYVYRKISVIE